MGNLELVDGGESAVESRMQQLIAEFGTRLDEALIRALASDYDLIQTYEVVHSQLAQLAEFAPAEEATDFDPSGLGHLSDSDLGRFGVDNVTQESQLSTESATSISEISDGLETPCFTNQTDLSEEDKVANLRMIFANFPDHTLKFELKNAGGGVEKAFEALLTRQFLEETGELPKGVDGFQVIDENSNRRKYTRKREPKSKPGRAQLPVTYAVGPPRLDADGLVESLDAVTLQPTRIPQPHFQDQRTGNVPQRPLTDRPNGSPSHLPRAVKAPAPGPHAWQTVSAKKKTTKTKSAEPPPVPGASATTYAETAAALRRKGGLYRPAAAYFDQKHREDKRTQREGSWVYYQELVEQQSSSHKTDLHGVPVLEGVKIAKDRVQAWWDELSEGERERRAAIHGFSVVTGVGYHSSVKGDSVLRRAVGAMLKNSGWKFETLTGQFHVTGKVG